MKRSTALANNGVKYGVVALFWLLVWQLIYMLVKKDYIVPSPWNTAKALGEMILAADFYVNTAITVSRVLWSMALSFAAGGVSAVAAYFFPLVRAALGGIAAAFKAMPVMSVILFAILCLASGMVPIFAGFLMCYPVVYTNLLSGLDSMNPEHLELCKVYHINFSNRLKSVYLPSISPYLKAALSLIAGLCWKAVVAAEVLASPVHSMGYQLLTAKIYLEADMLFAWTIAIIFLSLLFEKGVKEALKWL